MNLPETASLFVFLAGFVVGLGAVTVIDLHGFLGRKSSYWTVATTRTHKITKPLIWLGITLAVIGGFFYHQINGFSSIAKIHLALAVILILNGFFLSFVVSPFLLKREAKGQDSKLLPRKLQFKITISFLISFFGWWSALLLLVWHLLHIR